MGPSTTLEMTVPLMPMQRPMPKALAAHYSKEMTKVASKKKNAAFVATNVENITDKPAPIHPLWALLSKMDPDGSLFVADKGIIAVEGSPVADSPTRSPAQLGLSPMEKEWVQHYAVYDGPTPDDQSQATGLIFTMYQFIELAFSMGVQWENARVNSAIIRAADDSDDDLDDEVESSTEDEEMDHILDDDDEEVVDDDDDDDV